MAKVKGKNLKKKAKARAFKNALAQLIIRKSKKKHMRRVKKQRVTDSSVNACGPRSYTVEATSHVSASEAKIAVSRSKGKNRKDLKKLCGFIFLCDGKTKADCYRYRVFGLPKAKKEEVEKIQLGTKLFVFDVNLKLLYGVYNAESVGKMNLEPDAFGGRYPAQVKFGIYIEVLPLPERFFKHAIKDNYQGFKFKPELSKQQVHDLLSLFRPLTESILPPVVASTDFASHLGMPLSAPTDRAKHSGKILPANDIYLGLGRHRFAPPAVKDQLPLEKQQIGQQICLPEYGRQGTVTYLDQAHLVSEYQSRGLRRLVPPTVGAQPSHILQTSDHQQIPQFGRHGIYARQATEIQGCPAPSHLYNAPDSSWSYSREGLEQIMPEPYSRYRSDQVMVSQNPHMVTPANYGSDQVMVSQNPHTVTPANYEHLSLQRRRDFVVRERVISYRSYSIPASSHVPSVMQPGERAPNYQITSNYPPPRATWLFR